ncbi:MAG: 3-deoxy-manno-octulosonate cytidylyltransferase [Bacteroidales bacterium]|nr:3-deoxy-manno-octulosonate cytidylyltransferase [Bacteroidales bacterium]MBN2820596.1 3-deoxy-manno-octulosonate cytidylyltransferase [Bacteroidales bacterium]
MNQFLGIIPARYGSTRFPGKPLADIGGKPMIQRVCEQASKALDNVVVATDDERIYKVVKDFGGKVVMTSSEHRSGTDRCFEAFKKYSEERNTLFDVVINIQGDEPFIRPDQIELLKSCFESESTDIATLIKKIDDTEVVFNENKPKVVVNRFNEALYFSRSPVPFIRSAEKQQWDKKHSFYQHIGMYAYRVSVLEEIIKMPFGLLEQAESLEQLRWLENGLKIKTAVTDYESYGIDTPEDLSKAIQMGMLK